MVLVLIWPPYFDWLHLMFVSSQRSAKQRWTTMIRYNQPLVCPTKRSRQCLAISLVNYLCPYWFTLYVVYLCLVMLLRFYLLKHHMLSFILLLALRQLTLNSNLLSWTTSLLFQITLYTYSWSSFVSFVLLGNSLQIATGGRPEFRCIFSLWRQSI